MSKDINLFFDEEIIINKKSYFIKEEIGNGKDGLVYRAEDINEQSFTIKYWLIDDDEKNEIQQMKYNKQIEIIQKIKDIQHPYIQQLIDYEQIRIHDINIHALVMQYVEYHGTSNMRLREDTALKVILQVCTAIQYLHDYGIIYRNIKSEYILFNVNGDAFLNVFGFVRKEVEVLEPSIAPEVLYRYQNETDIDDILRVYNTATDIWSIGILACQLVLGKQQISFTFTENENQIMKKMQNITQKIKNDKIKQLILNFAQYNQLKRPQIRGYLLQYFWNELVQFNLQDLLKDNEHHEMLSNLMIAARDGNLSDIRKFKKLQIKLRGKQESKKGYTALMYAVEGNKLQCVKELIEEIGIQNDEGDTALIIAIRCKNNEIIQMLIPYEKGIQNLVGETALFEAVQSEQYQYVDSLISEAGSIVRDGMSLLMTVAKSGNVKVIKQIKHKEFRLQSKQDGKLGYTALMYATEQQNLECVNELIDETGIQNSYGDTALMIAIEKKNEVLIKILASHEKQILNKNGDSALIIALQNNMFSLTNTLILNQTIIGVNGLTALMIASQQNQINAVILIKNIEQKQKSKEIGKIGFTALMYAVLNNNIQCAMELLEETQIQNEAGETALTIAIQCQYIQLIQLLAPFEKDIKTKDHFPLDILMQSTNVEVLKTAISFSAIIGITTLMLAAKGGYINALQLLLANKQEIRKQGTESGKEGYTALMYVTESDKIDISIQQECVQALIDEIGLKNSEGKTALVLAIQQQNEIIIRILAKYEKTVTYKDQNNQELYPLELLCFSHYNSELIKELMTPALQVDQQLQQVFIQNTLDQDIPIRDPHTKKIYTIIEKIECDMSTTKTTMVTKTYTKTKKELKIQVAILKMIDENNNKLICKLSVFKGEKRTRSFKEVEILDHINHEYIIKQKTHMILFDTDMVCYIFLVMEEGYPLQLFFKNGMTYDQLRQITIQLSQGIEFLHSQKIIHRDIKPDNILIIGNNSKLENWKVVIIDFDISVVLNNIEDVITEPWGTPGYMAPEIDCGKYSFSCDFYSFGCTLREICSKYCSKCEGVQFIQNLANRLKDIDSNSRISLQFMTKFLTPNLNNRFFAAICGDFQKIYEMGPKYEYQRFEKQYTTLMIATEFNQADCVNQTLYETKLQDEEGNTALMIAIRNKNVGIADLLIHDEISITNKKGDTSLMMAMKWGVPNLLQNLIIQTKLQNCDGYTALMYATEACLSDCVQELIQDEAKMKNKAGDSSLIIAIRRKNEKLIKMLAPHEKDIQNNDGKVPYQLFQDSGLNPYIAQFVITDQYFRNCSSISQLFKEQNDSQVLGCFSNPSKDEIYIVNKILEENIPNENMPKSRRKAQLIVSDQSKQQLFCRLECIPNGQLQQMEQIDVLATIQDENVVKQEQQFFIFDTQLNCYTFSFAKLNLQISEFFSQIVEMNPQFLLKIAIEVCKGVQYLHSQSIIHRNINPSNITIQGSKSDWKAVVIGLSNCIAVKNIEHDISEPVQNIGFGAPEINLGHYNYKCDLYSIGKTLSYLLQTFCPNQSDEQTKQIKLVVESLTNQDKSGRMELKTVIQQLQKCSIDKEEEI